MLTETLTICPGKPASTDASAHGRHDNMPAPWLLSAVWWGRWTDSDVTSSAMNSSRPGCPWSTTPPDGSRTAGNLSRTSVKLQHSAWLGPSTTSP